MLPETVEEAVARILAYVVDPEGLSGDNAKNFIQALDRAGFRIVEKSDGND